MKRSKEERYRAIYKIFFGYLLILYIIFVCYAFISFFFEQMLLSDVINRCPTRDRLLGWGLAVDPMCLLCNAFPESRDHLLFECSYSWDVWSQTAARCRIATPRDWIRIVNYLNSLRLPKPHKKLVLIAWQCSIYLLWSERNSRLHRSCFRSPQSLLSSMNLIVKNRCSSLRSQNPSTSSAMIQMWMQ